MKFKFSINYKNIFLFILFYFSLIIGFYLGEDLNFGATGDWFGTNYPVIRDSSIDIKNTLLNYESYGHRHSPVYLIFLSFFSKIGLSFDAIRFLHLNISLLLIYFFYKCLVLKFNKVDRNLLIILSLSIFLSPTFRSLAIWPDSRIIGLTFFVLSIYEFLKFQKNFSNVHLWKNLIYLIISSYISPNFSLFIVYFFYHYLKKTNFKILILILLFCFILSLPAFYYLFVLDINFLTAHTPGAVEAQAEGLSFNFSNKILIISSIILFHLIPFVVNKKFIAQFFQSSKENIIIISIFFLLNLIFFDYVTNFTGGGFFFQISNFLIKNNIIFYLFSFLSLLLLAYFAKNNINNFLIFFLLIFSNIQNTIYHKYYDPLIMILFFTIISNFLSEEFFKRKINLFYLYSFYSIFILIRVAKNFIYLNS
jgi:hypothetical protein